MTTRAERWAAWLVAGWALVLLAATLAPAVVAERSWRRVNRVARRLLREAGL